MEILFILLIAAAVWVLQYVFRGPEDKKVQNQPRPGAGGARAVGNRPRRQTTDLDRFLEETRKQRQQDARPVVVAEVVQESAVERTEAMQRERRKASMPPKPPPARPTAAPVSRRPRTPPPAPPPPPPEPLRRPSMPTAAETPKTTAFPIAQIPVAVALPGPPVPRDARTSSRPDTIPALDSRRREELRIAAGPVQMELARMLRTPNGLLAAMILREVFGPPHCRRHR